MRIVMLFLNFTRGDLKFKTAKKIEYIESKKHKV
jgi:hypothetical protein